MTNEEIENLLGGNFKEESLESLPLVVQAHILNIMLCNIAAPFVQMPDDMANAIQELTVKIKQDNEKASKPTVDFFNLCLEFRQSLKNITQDFANKSNTFHQGPSKN